jgi:hypothetical protein
VALLNAIGFIIFFFQGLYNLAVIVMLNNTIEYDELRFGERHDSVISAIRSFSVKLAGAVNQGISALIVNTQKGKDWVDKAASAWFMEEYPLERVCANNSMLVRAGKENAHRAQFFSQLDATPIETNLNQYIVHENGIKLRVTQALVAVGLYKPLRNAVRKLRRR